MVLIRKMVVSVGFKSRDMGYSPRVEQDKAEQ